MVGERCQPGRVVFRLVVSALLPKNVPLPRCRGLKRPFENQPADASDAVHEVVRKAHRLFENYCLRGLAPRLPAIDADVELVHVAAPSVVLRRKAEAAQRLVDETLRIRRVHAAHCDPSASHYLKAVMDAIFGGRYFRSEIVWKRSHSHNSARRYGPIHDVILFYTKSDKYVWRDVRQPYDPAYVERYFKFDDEDGRGPYWTGDITGSGVRNGKTGMPWRGFNPTAKKRHWMVAPSELDRMDADGRVYWPRTQGAWPKVKRFLSEAKGIPLQDLIVDIWGLSTMGGPKSERLGYPTQKPLALMKRIIEASSREGDVVLDPFCGCGTTVAAARDGKRRFVGIDISHFAIDLVRERRLKDRSIPINGVPVDMHTASRLAKDDPLEFEKWAVTRVPGMVPNATQIGDRGIDGRGKLLDGGLVLAQVKGGKFALGQFRDFLHVVGREDATCGVFTTLRPVQSPNAKREANEAGYLQLGANRYPKTQFWSIADYFQDRLPILPPLADPYTGKAMQRDILAG